MAVQKSALSASSAVKAAFDDLLQQIGKHKDLRCAARTNGSGVASQISRPQSPAVAFEDTVAAVRVPTASSDDIRTYVNASLGRLERFVERELFFRETAEEIVPDSITKEEVIDEAIVRALSNGTNGGEKPERLALEPWLYRLALRSIDDLSARSPESLLSVHLEESARRQNVRASD